MPLDVARMVSILRSIAQEPSVASGIVHLHEPLFVGREWEYVKDCIDTGWVSTVGAYVDRFEAMIASRCNAAHAVALVNGTAALHLALLLLGVRSGDEVIIPSLTFVATANAVCHASAIPHIADSSERTLGLDPEKLARHLAASTRCTRDGLVNRSTGRRIAAIVPMHVFGHCVDMDAIIAVADQFGLPVVEDAAEALGSLYKGQPAGSLGRVGVLSFNGNKIVTTGGGGAIVTNDKELAGRARHLATTAKRPHAWAFEHDAVGYNYRLPNINAALGCAQLELLDDFLVAKRRLAGRYATAFADVYGIEVFKEPKESRSNYWLNTLILDRESATERDLALAATHNVGIMTRPVWTPIHRLPMYSACPKMDLSVAEDLERRIINIPSSAVLGLA